MTTVKSVGYVIWSKEHNGWWRPGRMGYTDCLFEAGRYSKAEAHEIMKKANIMWDGQGMPEEMAVPDWMALECFSPEVRAERYLDARLKNGKYA